MRRQAFALLAGLLLLGLFPGTGLAGTPLPTNLDQSNTVWIMAWVNPKLLLVAQTFTAGETGNLSQVDLDLSGTESVPVSIENVTSGKPDGTTLGSVTIPENNTYGCMMAAADFTTLSTPVALTAGTTYAIVFPMTGDHFCGSPSGDSYPGGELWLSGNGGAGWVNLWDSTTDLNFQTWMSDAVKSTLGWNKASVPSGTSTPLVLTATMAFINGAGDGVASYSAAGLALPSWFTPSGITCTDSATPSNFTASNCTLSNFLGAGITVPKTDPGDTLTFTVSGNAAPAAANVGKAGVASGQGCVVRADPVSAACATVTASVAVVAGAPVSTPTPTAPVRKPTPSPTTAPAPTPTPSPTKTPAPTPPTTAESETSSNDSGSMMWFLPVVLIAFLGSLVLAFARTRRRIA